MVTRYLTNCITHIIVKSHNKKSFNGRGLQTRRLFLYLNRIFKRSHGGHNIPIYHGGATLNN